MPPPVSLDGNKMEGTSMLPQGAHADAIFRDGSDPFGLSVRNNSNSACNDQYQAITGRFSDQISDKLPRTELQYPLKPTPIVWSQVQLEVV